MDIIQAIFLGIVQGLTEFLPVSSSGHLVLFQKVFGFKEAPVFFDTILHGATLAAVIFYLRKDILDIIKDIKNSQKIIILVALGTIPAVFFGLFFRDTIEKSFNSVWLLSAGFFITALMLFATKFLKENGKNITGISWIDSLVVGVFQALSILPSISRSGATISSGIFMGIDRRSALKFSFLLSMPAILGAIVLQVFDINGVSSGEIFYSIIGFFPAMFLGFWSLKFLDKYMANKKFSLFAYYCLVLGFLSLIFIY